MDLLGNLATNIGFRQNSTGGGTFTHDVNATNEITTITRGNPGGQARVVYDDFTGPDFADMWTVNENYWSISSGKAQVDSMGSPTPAYRVELTGPAIVDDGALQAKIELPSGGARPSSTTSRWGTIIRPMTTLTTGRMTWSSTRTSAARR